MFPHQPCGNREPVFQKGRIDPALEPLARIAGQHQFLPGAGDMFGIEIGALDQHVGRLIRTARMRAAHDPGYVMHRDIVGDHGHAGIQPVRFAVERNHLFAIPRLAGDQRAAQLGPVIDVQGAAQIERDKIGNIHQRGNRLLAYRFEPVRHPFRCLPIGHARNALRVKGRAGCRIVSAHIRRGISSHNGCKHAHPVDVAQWFQRPQSRRCQITRNSAHAHAILPVGGDRDINHWIIQIGIVGKRGANRCVGGQFDDSVMIIAQLQLTR